MTTPLRTKLVSAMEGLLLLVLCVFLVGAWFSPKVVKYVFCDISGLWILLSIARHGRSWWRHIIPRSVLDKPIVIFFFVCLASTVLSSDFRHSQRIFFERYCMYFIFFLIGVGIGSISRKFRVILLWVFLAWGLVFAVGGVRDVLFYSKSNPVMVDRLWSVYTWRIPYYAFPLCVCFLLPFSFMVALRARHRVLRAVAVISSILLFSCLFWNASRIAWAAVVVSMLFAFLALSRKRLFVVLAVFCIIIGISFAIPKTRARLMTIPFASQWSDRVPLFKTALLMTQDHIFLGSGLGTFEKTIRLNRYELPANYPVPKELNLHAHNTYLEVAAETGVVGLLAFLAIFILFFLRAVPAGYSSESPLTQDERAFLCGITSSIAAVLVFAMGASIITVGPTMSTYFWFLLGVGVSFLTLPAALRE